ncbi:MAG: nitric oxide-sensing protein NosP [Rhodospirillales bacterium]
MYVGRRSCVRRGGSLSRDPRQAARELFDGIYDPAASLSIFFASTDYDLPALERELRGRFAGTALIGCTSAGELTPAGYSSGGIVGFSLSRPDFVTVSATIENLRQFSIAEGNAIVRSMRHQLDQDAGGLLPDNTFAFLLIDGLCKCEEVVLSAISSALGDIPLFGGSSGGGLTFQGSYVFDRGRFRAESAVLVMVRTRAPFRLFTADHFVNSATRMVVTEADPVTRIVTEINAEPAGREYARLLGLAVDKLTPMIFATHPVVVKVGGRYYTRSIQKVNDDESLTFFCAIDRGVVLTLARATDLLSSATALFDELNVAIGPPQLVIGCECILRALELEEKQQKAEAGRLLAANNVIGFSTFGEQFQAMHVNQTFTGAAIGVGVADKSTWVS